MVAGYSYEGDKFRNAGLSSVARHVAVFLDLTSFTPAEIQAVQCYYIL